MTLLLLFNTSKNSGPPPGAQAVTVDNVGLTIYGTEKETPLLWLVEIIALQSGTPLRFVNNPKPMDFQEDDEGADITWQAGNFEVGNIRSDGRGALHSVEVTIQNVTREIGAYLEFQDGLAGSAARVMLVDVATYTNGIPLLEITGKVLNANADAGAASFQIGKRNLLKRRYPKNRINRDFCWKDYGGPECGYNVPETSVHYLPTCDKTKDGQNGCVVHGQSEIDNGNNPVLHPERFGGAPGLIRVGGLGT